ncbi:MAG: hypothetical protein V1847_00880 [Candidatus Diapherotrites archaeon]
MSKQNRKRDTERHFSWLKRRIARDFGRKCPDYEETCIVCRAWEVYGLLREVEKDESD